MKYFFIGIKGSGMSALAQILHDQGNEVAGSDIEQFTFTQTLLQKAGISVIPFSPNNIKTGSVIVQGNAFDQNHPEVRRAIELGLEIKSYPQIVQELIAQHISIGVAGAHGKTSTTGLLAHVFSSIESTDYLIGDGTGKASENAKFFIFEADEYRRHFQDYQPDYAIMTNIDFDHPDYFHDIQDVQLAFEEFGSHVKKQLIVLGDDPLLNTLKTNTPKVTYGFLQTNDFVAKNVQKTTSGSTFEVFEKGNFVGNFSIPLFGNHGILNALAVIAVSKLEALDMQLVRDSLLTFNGVKRRFAEKMIGNTVIIDDYAHHPSEISATIDAAKQKYPDKQIVAVFQPHTFSRVIAYQDDFAKSLEASDKTYLVDIFGSARETSGEVSSEDLGKKINNFAGIIDEKNIVNLLENQDAVMVFMGAGDIGKYESLYETLLQRTIGTTT